MYKKYLKVYLILAVISILPTTLLASMLHKLIANQNLNGIRTYFELADAKFNRELNQVNEETGHTPLYIAIAPLMDLIGADIEETASIRAIIAFLEDHGAEVTDDEAEELAIIEDRINGVEQPRRTRRCFASQQTPLNTIDEDIEEEEDSEQEEEEEEADTAQNFELQAAAAGRDIKMPDIRYTSCSNLASLQ
ncbi:MAG: hypothetical protein O2897_01325 [bacterium]|nr:hypothetical protein [bacterium]